MNDLKIVYSKWLSVGNKQYPVANGTTDSFAVWAQNEVTAKNLRPTGEFDHFREFDDYFFFNASDYKRSYIYRNSNFYLHCKKNDIPFIFSGDVVNDGSTYYYPIEIECDSWKYLIDNDRDYDFFETLDDCTLNLLRSGQVQILLVNMVDPGLLKETAQEVYDHFVSRGINKFTCLTGNHSYECDPNITNFDAILSLYQTANEAEKYPRNTALGYVSDYVREQDLTDQIRKKKFICFNRFMNRCHRAGMAHLALEHNLLDQGYFSFLYNFSNDYKDRLEQLGLPTHRAEEINSLVPYQVDTENIGKDQLPTFFSVTNYKKELYTDSYIHIVTETQFEQNASPFMSEKTWRPILNLQPFIYLGNPLALNTLRKLGFKTFEPFINESYDVETDPVKRFSLIEQEIKKFANMNIQDIHTWYTSIREDLIFNQHLLLSYKNYNPLCNLQNIN